MVKPIINDLDQLDSVSSHEPDQASSHSIEISDDDDFKICNESDLSEDNSKAVPGISTQATVNEDECFDVLEQLN